MHFVHDFRQIFGQDNFFFSGEVLATAGDGKKLHHENF